MSSLGGDDDENPSLDDMVWEVFGDCEDNTVPGGTLEDWPTDVDRRKRARRDLETQNGETIFEKDGQLKFNFDGSEDRLNEEKIKESRSYDSDVGIQRGQEGSMNEERYSGMMEMGSGSRKATQENEISNSFQYNEDLPFAVSTVKNNAFFGEQALDSVGTEMFGTMKSFFVEEKDGGGYNHEGDHLGEMEGTSQRRKFSQTNSVEASGNQDSLEICAQSEERMFYWGCESGQGGEQDRIKLAPNLAVETQQWLASNAYQSTPGDSPPDEQSGMAQESQSQDKKNSWQKDSLDASQSQRSSAMEGSQRVGSVDTGGGSASVTLQSNVDEPYGTQDLEKRKLSEIKPTYPSPSKQASGNPGSKKNQSQGKSQAPPQAAKKQPKKRVTKSMYSPVPTVAKTPSTRPSLPVPALPSHPRPITASPIFSPSSAGLPLHQQQQGSLVPPFLQQQQQQPSPSMRNISRLSAPVYQVTQPGSMYCIPEASHMQQQKQSLQMYQGSYMLDCKPMQYNMSSLGRSPVPAQQQQNQMLPCNSVREMTTSQHLQPAQLQPHQQMPLQQQLPLQQMADIVISSPSTQVMSQGISGQPGYNISTDCIAPLSQTPVGQQQAMQSMQAHHMGSMQTGDVTERVLPSQRSILHMGGPGQRTLSSPITPMSLPLPGQQGHLAMGSPMTPQEKIEKLRWRQEMRMAAEQRRQHQQHLHGSKVVVGEQNAVMVPVNNSSDGMQEVGIQLMNASQGTMQGSSQNHPQHNGPSVPQFNSGFSPGILQSPQGFRTGGTRMVQPGMVDVLGQSGRDHNSVDATVLDQMQGIMTKLDVGTRLCIRDALFRLAHSSMQRKAVESNSSLHSGKRPQGSSVSVSAPESLGGSGNSAAAIASPTVSTTPQSQQTHEQLKQGGSNTVHGQKSASIEHAGSCVQGISAYIETETNPIDRNIAHLLFHRPSPTQDGSSGPVPSPASGASAPPQPQRDRIGRSAQMTVSSPSLSAPYYNDMRSKGAPVGGGRRMMVQGGPGMSAAPTTEPKWGWNASVGAGSVAFGSAKAYTMGSQPQAMRMPLPSAANSTKKLPGKGWHESGKEKKGKGTPDLGNDHTPKVEVTNKLEEERDEKSVPQGETEDSRNVESARLASSCGYAMKSRPIGTERGMQSTPVEGSCVSEQVFEGGQDNEGGRNPG